MRERKMDRERQTDGETDRQYDGQRETKKTDTGHEPV